MLVAASGLVTLVLPLFVVPMFRRLTESLGPAAPSTAGTMLQGWAPVAAGLIPLGLVVYAIAVRQPVMRRRLILVLAFALTVLASVFLLVAIYGALFAMAGAASG